MSRAINSIAVLIVSCDNYADLWDPFFDLFRRFWPDCPFPVYLLSNYKRCEAPGVITIDVGEDHAWSDNLLNGLNRIKEEFVFMWIDDLFLLEKIDTESLLRVCNEFIKVEGNYIRLNPTVKADTRFNEYFGLVSTGTIYRTSTVLSLWRKEVLRELLREGESAWDFEIHGTVRSDVYDGFFAAWRSCFTIVNGVIKGKWQRKAYKKIRTFCPNAALDRRRIMSFAEGMVFSTKVIRAWILSRLPARYRRRIKDIVLFGKYNYRVSRTGMKDP
jgi:hypothetical protein